MNDIPCIIVNMTELLDNDGRGNHVIIPERKRPKYVHDDLESAEKEALRLHKEYGGPKGRFVIFQAVQATTWRDTWTIATSPVAALEPYTPPEPLTIPERARKPKANSKKKAKP